MKKIFDILLVGFAALLVGCNMNGDGDTLNNDAQGDVVRFGISEEITKVTFDTDPVGALNILWQEGDQIGISATKDGALFGCNYLYKVEECLDGGVSANLAATSNLYMYRWAEKANYTFCAYYPFKGVQGDGVHYMASLSLPSTQNQQRTGDIDHLKDLWVMKAEPVKVADVQNTIDFSFRGVFSIVELKLRYSEESAASRNIERVQLNSLSEPLAAQVANLMLDTDRATDDREGALAISDGSNAVDVMLEHSISLTTDQTASVWLLVVPGSHAAGELGIQLQTTNSYRLDLTIDEAVNFEPNKVYRKEIVVNPGDFYYWKDPNAPSVTYYKPVTKLEDLTAGEYIIGYDFKNENQEDMWLKCNPATRNPVAGSYEEAEVEFYGELGILSVADGFVWTLESAGENRFKISTKDAEGNTWLLNGANKAQGIAIAQTVTGHYQSTDQYSNVWVVSVAEENAEANIAGGEFIVQSELAPARYMMIDIANKCEWRNAGSTSAADATFVFYKKVTE